MATFELRPASREDAAAIAAVHAESRRVAYADLLPERELMPWPGRDRVERWRRLLLGEAPGLETTVAVDPDGRVLGLCSTVLPEGAPGYPAGGAAAGAAARDPGPGDASADGSTPGEIAALYVDPGSWRSGVGRALAEDALARLAAGGCRVARVRVLAGNEPALSLYRALGFERDEDAGPPGRDELTLSRTIGDPG